MAQPHHQQLTKGIQQMSRRTKTVTLTNRHGEEQKMKLEPLRAISKRLWVKGKNIRSARKPEGSKVWTEFSRFDQHLYRAFKDERIELAWQDDSNSSKSKVFAYEECVLRYVEHYLARWARKSPKTKMMTIAGTVDLLHEPQFPEEHGKKGKVIITFRRLFTALKSLPSLRSRRFSSTPTKTFSEG